MCIQEATTAKTGRVAVVMPLYNTERFLNMAIGSIIRQNYKNFKLFIVDDNSSDNSLNIAQQWQTQLPHIIQVIKHDQNRGAGAALNTGFGCVNAEGGFEYGTMVSSDNIYHSHFLETLVDALNSCNEDIVMAYGDFVYIDELNRETGVVNHRDVGGRSDLINGYDQGICFLFRMSAKNKAGDYWLRICEDYAMAVQLARCGNFQLVSKVLGCHRIRSGQLTFSNNVEECRAAEYSKRLANNILFNKNLSLEGIYPTGVNPWKHRRDTDV